MRARGTTFVFALLFAMGLGVAVSACGTTATTSTAARTGPAERIAPHSPVAGHAPAPRVPRRRTPPPPRVGTPQRVQGRGTTLIVTVTSVIDPLHGSGAQVPPGMKAVGVLVSARNAGPGAYDSSATGDFSMLSAAGQASPVFVPAGPCQTPLQDFMNAISVGELRMGCVAFAIPTGQAPLTVRFAPNGGAAGHHASWSVP